MSASRNRPQRRSPRLQGYDYGQNGAYFVTICTQNRECLFGKVVGDQIHLNDAGMMLSNWWEKLPGNFSNTELDFYTVMPNHFHGIIVLHTTGAGNLWLLWVRPYTISYNGLKL
jgi:putative transposase